MVWVWAVFSVSFSETRWSFPLAHSSPRDDGALPRGSAPRLAYLTGALARGSRRPIEALGDSGHACDANSVSELSILCSEGISAALSGLVLGLVDSPGCSGLGLRSRG